MKIKYYFPNDESFIDLSPHRPRRNVTVLPSMADMLKRKANSFFENEKYNQAILLYNQAINVEPNSSILYGNRAAAFMKRKW